MKGAVVGDVCTHCTLILNNVKGVEINSSVWNESWLILTMTCFVNFQSFATYLIILE